VPYWLHYWLHPVLWWRHRGGPAFYLWLACKLPKRLCYWVLIRMAGRCELGWDIRTMLKQYDDWYY